MNGLLLPCRREKLSLHFFYRISTVYRECLIWESLSTAEPLKQTEGGRRGNQYRKTVRDAGSILPLSFIVCLHTHVCAACVCACMCVPACVHVCAMCLYAVSCAAFVLKRLRRARVCVCVCGACVRCMCAFARAVCVCV